VLGVPLGVVTVMPTVPAPSAGATATSEPSGLTVKLVAAALPKDTAEAPAKFVPLISTAVPPAVGPAFGLTAVTVGAPAAVEVKWSALPVLEVPPKVVTVTSTVPAASDGATATTCESELAVKSAAGTVPQKTPVAPVKPLPEMVRAVPPAVVPEVVPRPVTAGTGPATKV
jgi:hypothetical protein